MRIKLQFTATNINVPINDQAIIPKSYIHNCLGKDNHYHGHRNSHSISMVCGGKISDDKQSLTYPNGSYIIVSSHDGKFITDLLNGMSKNRDIELGYGMQYDGYMFIQEKFNSGWNNFATLSPILIVKDNNEIGRKKHLLLDEPDFATKFRSYLLNKLQVINTRNNLSLNLSYFDLQVPNHHAHKIKRIYMDKVVNGQMHRVKNYTNQCHFNIRCDKKVAELLYSVGVGKSTQNGFGTIYCVENKELYTT